MNELTIGNCVIELTQGDITSESCDAIVNAANRTLLGGGGVDGAIHRKGGGAILDECRTLNACDTGDAKITTGGNLPAKHVIHTVGPVWHGGEHGEADLLASCYRRSLEVARENDCASVAFPSISTGAYGYPIEAASRIALDTVHAFLKDNRAPARIRFVLFSEFDFSMYEKALERIAAP